MQKVKQNIVGCVGAIHYVLHIQKSFLNSSQARSLSRHSVFQALKARNIAFKALSNEQAKKSDSATPDE
ncbi:MAG: hypothetical protein JRN52_09030 [Nitrososphaerota archaeon]|nr:hypothetical protein [Nitrososphaerota archaeon]